MSAAILIVSHGEMGNALIDVAEKMIGHFPVQIDQVGIDFDTPIDQASQQVSTKLEKLNRGEGVLVLTDIFGATPSNVACQFQQSNKIAIVSGINLPMLLKVVSEPRLSLEEMRNRAIESGKTGIIHCTHQV
jgi:mannose PTS system EIIA component